MREFDNQVLHFIREHLTLSVGSRLLVACSGGVDSMVLLHFLAAHQTQLAIEVGAVHVDHMLRGEESVAEGEQVKAFCEQLNIPFFGGRIPVPKMISEKGGNTQAVCREGRYTFFKEVMRTHRYDQLATAHHAEDQLETVLMQVTKGMSPLGIPIKREIEGGTLIRPFLSMKKEAIYLYAGHHDIIFSEDPSNASSTYMRNRFRQSIVPAILRENASAAEKVVEITTDLQEDARFLQSMAKEYLEAHIEFTEEGLPTMEIRRFSNMPTALQRRVIPLLLGYLYDQQNLSVFYKSGLMEQLLQHLRSEAGSVSLDLPFGFRFLRTYGKFSFVKPTVLERATTESDLPQAVQVKWMDGLWLYWTEITNVPAELLLRADEVMYFTLPSKALPLSVRNRRDGDRILLPGMSSPKRLSRLFIDEKVEKTLRDRLPIVVTQQGEICAIPGLRYGMSFTKSKAVEKKYIFLTGHY